MTDGMLLLHAFPLDSTMWAPQVEGLGGDVAVVAPDLPGFGRAPAASPVLTMAAAADAAARALDDAGIDRAMVCGLSMGGYVALAMWRSHRRRVAGLVLANTRAGADDDQGRERRRALAERVRAQGIGFLVDTPPPLLSAGAPPELWAMVRQIISAQAPEAIAAASLAMAERADSTPDLPGIGVPTLVITSSEDALIVPEASVRMGTEIPGARVEVIAGPGHLSNLEAPHAFNRLLREYLRTTGLLAE